MSQGEGGGRLRPCQSASGRPLARAAPPQCASSCSPARADPESRDRPPPRDCGLASRAALRPAPSCALRPAPSCALRRLLPRVPHPLKRLTRCHTSSHVPRRAAPCQPSDPRLSPRPLPHLVRIALPHQGRLFLSSSFLASPLFYSSFLSSLPLTSCSCSSNSSAPHSPHHADRPAPTGARRPTPKCLLIARQAQGHPSPWRLADHGVVQAARRRAHGHPL